MEIKDSQVDVLLVAIAVSVALESLDSALDGFQFAGADAMFIADQDGQCPYKKLLSVILENFDAAEACLSDPSVKFRCGGLGIRRLKQPPPSGSL